MLHILAAGSLRRVWAPLTALFQTHSGVEVTTQFGPAGLLRRRIEAGEHCDLFASANAAHPAALTAAGRARRSFPFASNQLCLTVAAHAATAHDDWLSLLDNPGLRLATSTPGSDPGGDYAWQFFDNLEKQRPGLGRTLKQKAECLVGGPESPAIPQGEMAAAWLIHSGQTDMFIGYASYAPRLRQRADLVVYDIPQSLNVMARYTAAVCSPQGEMLGEFLRSESAADILQHYGFGRYKY